MKNFIQIVLAVTAVWLGFWLVENWDNQGQYYVKVFDSNRFVYFKVNELNQISEFKQLEEYGCLTIKDSVLVAGKGQPQCKIVDWGKDELKQEFEGIRVLFFSCLLTVALLFFVEFKTDNYE